MQTPHYEPNGSARAGEGRSVVRGRVLSQSLLVARERRRREPGYNPVIDTTALTSGEGHVVKDGTSRRVRKILAGVPASVVIRDHILALSFSRSQRQYWTVGNRPIRNYDLRSLRRISAEAQIQDRSRQKTGLNTAPGFSRVYPSFPRTREPREKQSTPFSSPSRSEGDACAARRGCTKFTTPVVPADYPVIPASPRHSRGRGNPEQNKARRPPHPTPNSPQFFLKQRRVPSPAGRERARVRVCTFGAFIRKYRKLTVFDGTLQVSTLEPLGSVNVRSERLQGVSSMANLKVRDVAERLDVSSKTVYKWLREGLIPASRLGKSWIISEEALQAALAPGSNRPLASAVVNQGADAPPSSSLVSPTPASRLRDAEPIASVKPFERRSPVGRINVAVVGLGNCASSLIQGIHNTAR